MRLIPFGATSTSAPLEDGFFWAESSCSVWVPATSAITIKADEGGVQEGTKEDYKVL